MSEKKDKKPKEEKKKQVPPTKKILQNKKKKPSGGPKKPNMIQIISMIFIFLVLGSLIRTEIEKDQESKEIALSELANEIKADNVKSITVRGEKLEVSMKDLAEKEVKKEREASLTETLVNYGVTADQLANVEIQIKKENGFAFWVSQAAPFLFPLVFILILLWFLAGQKGGMKAFSFGQSKAKIVDPKDQKIRFKDVAGNENAKQELEEIVDFLKEPKKFHDLGAQIPKGVLLMGAPGTGKTLLARAVAGEAKVPFFHLSGSEFVEMFVGVGASRVRDLFANAKKTAPAIIFIDEIDAVGRTRGAGTGGGNDEREQTLNQILVEMDGFNQNEKVIVIAATNRMDVLDKALLRPGRFDRRVILEVPDRKDRKAILEIHAKKKPLEGNVDFEVVAARTPGFSGADLESLMNEAAISAARAGAKKVTQEHILGSVDKVLIGPERKSHVHTQKERKITAYHEAGHAVVASVLPDADPVHKVSIVARGNAGGYTLKLPDEDKKMHTRAEFLDDLAMSLGGYVAEEMIFGDVTTGPSHDLQVSTDLARSMVSKWGMSESVGLSVVNTQKYGYAQKTLENIDTEVTKILGEAKRRAMEVLTTHRKALDAVANKLLEVETLEREEYEEVVKNAGVTIPARKA